MRNARFADAVGYPTWFTRTNAVGVTARAGTSVSIAATIPRIEARAMVGRSRGAVVRITTLLPSFADG
jgi:hypothetical protein